MALATDKDGLPLDYGLYKGNQAEGATMVPFVDELKKKFNIKASLSLPTGASTARAISTLW